MDASQSFLPIFMQQGMQEAEQWRAGTHERDPKQIAMRVGLEMLGTGTIPRNPFDRIAEKQERDIEILPGETKPTEQQIFEWEQKPENQELVKAREAWGLERGGSKIQQFWGIVQAHHDGIDDDLAEGVQLIKEGKLSYQEWREEHYAQKLSEHQAIFEFNRDQMGLTPEDLERDLSKLSRRDVEAEKYYSIQAGDFDKPENGGNGNGIIDSFEWTMHERAREEQLQRSVRENPDLANLEDYITKTRVEIRWQNPETRAMVMRLEQAKEDMDRFFETPRYLGFSAEDGDRIQQLRQLAAVYRTEILARVDVPKASELVTERLIWKALVSAPPPELGEGEMDLFKVAAALSLSGDLREALTNPARDEWLLSHQDIMLFYPSFISNMSADQEAMLGEEVRRTPDKFWADYAENYR